MKNSVSNGNSSSLNWEPEVSDWEYLGICSSPAVEGNRVYVVANSCEILCLDMKV